MDNEEIASQARSLTDKKIALIDGTFFHPAPLARLGKLRADSNSALFYASRANFAISLRFTRKEDGHVWNSRARLPVTCHYHRTFTTTSRRHHYQPTVLIEVKRFSFLMFGTRTSRPTERPIAHPPTHPSSRRYGRFRVGSRRYIFEYNEPPVYPCAEGTTTEIVYRSIESIRKITDVHHTYFRRAIEDGVLLAVLACLPARLPVRLPTGGADHGFGWIVEPASGRWNTSKKKKKEAAEKCVTEASRVRRDVASEMRKVAGGERKAEGREGERERDRKRGRRVPELGVSEGRDFAHGRYVWFTLKRSNVSPPPPRTPSTWALSITESLSNTRHDPTNRDANERGRQKTRARDRATPSIYLFIYFGRRWTFRRARKSGEVSSVRFQTDRVRRVHGVTKIYNYTCNENIGHSCERRDVDLSMTPG